jgi:hypothetical protein
MAKADVISLTIPAIGERTPNLRKLSTIENFP